MTTETFHAGPNLGRLSDVTIIHGDCIEAMRELADDSIDAIVCDPPYGLGFMGKAWDSPGPAVRPRADGDHTATPFKRSRAEYGGNSYGNRHLEDMREFGEWCEQWTTEALRVLKPGGHLLAFGGTRTWHRLACAVEDAGFEIRDSIAWLYGSGFPKSLDVSKAIDKAAGATREVVGSKSKSTANSIDSPAKQREHGYRPDWHNERLEQPTVTWDVTAPATSEAEQWQGWGTALKPAFEPVVVGRKPFKGNVAANVLTHGTGALNIDGCRIGMSDADRAAARVPNGRLLSSTDAGNNRATLGRNGETFEPAPAGRWPANVVLDESQAAALDEQSGTIKVSANKTSDNRTQRRGNDTYGGGYLGVRDETNSYSDTGGASRFFYCAKAPKKERPVAADGTAHPTVKPLALMRWLVRLVTPPGGVVLDPFAGSGTTVEAALLEGFRVIGIEREADYLPMIQQRIARCLNS